MFGKLTLQQRGRWNPHYCLQVTIFTPNFPAYRQRKHNLFLTHDSRYYLFIVVRCPAAEITNWSHQTCEKRELVPLLNFLIHKAPFFVHSCDNLMRLPYGWEIGNYCLLPSIVRIVSLPIALCSSASYQPAQGQSHSLILTDPVFTCRVSP